jgi:hypothetical protein
MVPGVAVLVPRFPPVYFIVYGGQRGNWTADVRGLCCLYLGPAYQHPCPLQPSTLRWQHRRVRGRSECAHLHPLCSMHPPTWFCVALTSISDYAPTSRSNQAPPPNSRFATPPLTLTLTEDGPTPLPPTVLVNPFASFNTASPLPHTTYPLIPTIVSSSPVSRFSHPNPFAALESNDSDDDDCYHTPLLCSVIPPPILVDSGATHVLLRESVLPSFAHLMRPAHLLPCPSPFPMDRSSPLDPADTFTSLAFPSLFRSGLPLILPSLTLS